MARTEAVKTTTKKNQPTVKSAVLKGVTAVGKLPPKEFCEEMVPQYGPIMKVAADRIVHLETQNQHQADKLWLVTELLKLGRVRENRPEQANSCETLTDGLRRLARCDEETTNIAKRAFLAGHAQQKTAH